MRLPLLALFVSAHGLSSLGAGAAGVVGSGTPGSCTEAALNAALTGGGLVTFNCGSNPVTIGVTSQKTIAANTTVDGGNLVTLDGGSATRIFLTNYQVPFTVRNLTLQNARTGDFGAAIRAGYQAPLTVTDSRFYTNVCTQAGNDVGGGAIYVQGGDVLIQRVTFQGNRGGNGGAIGNLQSRLTVEDSVFTGNTTNASQGFGGSGGAIYIDGSNAGTITIRRSVFDGNSSTNVGGVIHSYMYAGASTLRVEDSLFRNNTTYGNAGAIYHQNGNLQIERCTFTGNQTQGQGGALWLLENWAGYITNSTFVGNRANGIPPNQGSSGLGGAILMNANNFLALSHLTITNNHADWVGGGICGGSQATLRGSVIAHNTANNGGNPWNIAHNCCTQIPDGGFNLQFPNRAHPGDSNDPNCTSAVVIGDPLLLPLADNGGLTPTMALPAASPARELIASGCPPPATDQRGVARPQGARCDAGAYEAPEPSLSVADGARAEGQSGSALLQLTVSLSAAASEVVTVQYATSDVSATGGSDYTPVSGSLTFPIGTLTRTVDVPVLGDLLNEADETLRVTLGSPSNASIADGDALGTIQNDDPLPTLSIGDASVAEGQAGTPMASFTVALSAPSGRSVSVDYATAAGTATAVSDFAAVSGQLQFAAGVTSRGLSVPVFGDTQFEADETFSVTLSGALNAGVSDGQAQGLIQNDDVSGLSVSDVSVAEGPAGTTTARFTVSLLPAAGGTVTVDYTTADGSAIAGSDYDTATGSLSFTAGETSKPVAVTVRGDQAREPSESFTLQLQNASGATVADASGLATIVDFRPADWNDDGRADIVFRHATSGRVVVWLMNGLVRQAGVFTSPDGWPDVNWQVVGTPDMNLDGRSDLLWRHNQAGDVRVWFMNGVVRTGEGATLPERLADPNWALAATGDMNGDGWRDLLWRSSVSGSLVAWLMEGSVRRQGAFTNPATLPDLNWRLVGTGDFNADNQTDLLWQHAVSGNVVCWLMNGLERLSGAYTTPSSAPDTFWRVQAVGDYDQDGKPDLLWRHGTSGKLVVWLMNGLVRTSGAFTTPDAIADVNWRIVGPK